MSSPGQVSLPSIAAIIAILLSILADRVYLAVQDTRTAEKVMSIEISMQHVMERQRINEERITRLEDALRSTQ